MDNEENITHKKPKITSVEIFVILIVLLGLAFYFIPKGLISIEKRQYGIIQTNAAIMTSKILSEFSDNEKKNKDINKVARILVDELNETIKNPMKKKNPAFTINEECLGCIVLKADKKVGNITLVSYDKEGNIITRTVIQPPSFVTYNKEYDPTND